MDKDPRNWPGGYPADAVDVQAKHVKAQPKESSEVHNAVPQDNYVKHTAKQFDSSASLTKLPPPSRWDVAPSHARPEQHAKSSSVLGSVVSMITGSPSPHKESNRAMEEHYQSELARAKWECEQLEKQNLQLQEQLEAQECESQHNLQEVINKAHEINAEERARHGTEMKNQQDANDWELRRIKQDFAAHIEAANKEKNIAENSCKKLEHEFEIMEQKIRDFQSAQLQSIEAVQWAPQSQSDIEHKLKSILARVRQWATEYSCLEIDHVLKPDFFASMARQLKKRGCIADADLLYGAIGRNKSMKKPGKAFSMMLAAVVSFQIFEKTIADPFCAFVGSSEEKHILGDRAGNYLNTLFEFVKGCDVAGAEGLRCQLLRLLDPVASGDAAVDKVKSVARKSRQCAAEKICSWIFDRFSCTLMAEKSNDGRRSLKALIQEAVDLSWELWTRKAHIRILDWAALEQCAGKSMKFSANTKVFEAHPLHNRDLEDDPEALDGAEVVLLCSPAIVASGTAEGHDYDRERLIKKAIVIVG